MNRSPSFDGTVTRSVTPCVSSSFCDHPGVDSVTTFGRAPLWTASRMPESLSLHLHHRHSRGCPALHPKAVRFGIRVAVVKEHPHGLEHCGRQDCPCLESFARLHDVARSSRGAPQSPPRPALVARNPTNSASSGTSNSRCVCSPGPNISGQRLDRPAFAADLERHGRVRN